MQHLNESEIISKSTRPILKLGDRGSAVIELQTKLRKFVDVQVDGHFGEKTFQAVRLFQRLEELDDDGVVGLNTWKKLER